MRKLLLAVVVLLAATAVGAQVKYYPPRWFWSGSTLQTSVPIVVPTAIEGSNTKTLADNTKAAFVKVGVPQASYVGGDLVYTLFCQDANDRVTRSGRAPFAAQGGDAGVETCALGAATSSGDVTDNAKSFAAATFSCADGGANTIQLEIQADCSIAAPTLITIEYRLDMPHAATVTPQ